MEFVACNLWKVWYFLQFLNRVAAHYADCLLCVWDREIKERRDLKKSVTQASGKIRDEKVTFWEEPKENTFIKRLIF